MAPKRWPANGHGLPSSRSACTNVTPGIDCGSRSTATTSRFLPPKKRACLPPPLATSSTGPRVTSAAQRTTHGEGPSEPCATCGEQLLEDRAVAAVLAFAIATNREVGMERELRK